MPQRFLRPQITNSERWNSVSFASGNFYIRLLTLVDDYGRYDGRTGVICGACFAVWNEKNPQDAVNLQRCEQMLQELAANELIDLYDINGKRVIQINQWYERIRNGVKEKWPAKVAGTCSNLLPSSPSPSPSSPPAPAPSGPPQVDFNEIPTFEDAFKMTMTAAIPKDFCEYVYEDWTTRQGKDAGGSIVAWLPYVTKRWRREGEEWKAGTHRGCKNKVQRQQRPAAVSEMDILKAAL